LGVCPRPCQRGRAIRWHQRSANWPAEDGSAGRRAKGSYGREQSTGRRSRRSKPDCPAERLTRNSRTRALTGLSRPAAPMRGRQTASESDPVGFFTLKRYPGPPCISADAEARRRGGTAPFGFLKPLQ
jgi:hypothetical protein